MLALDEQLTLWCQFDTLVKLSFPVRLLDKSLQTKMLGEAGWAKISPRNL